MIEFTVLFVLSGPGIKKIMIIHPILKTVQAIFKGFSSMTFMQDCWQCPQCTFINEQTRPGCEQCSEEKPEQETPVLFKVTIIQISYHKTYHYF